MKKNFGKSTDLFGPSVTEHEVQIVTDAMRNGWYGPDKYKYVELFESRFAEYHDRKFSLMTSNCTSAIHLALLANGVKEGDEIIAPNLTWIASVAPVKYLNAKLVLVDVDEDNWCIDPVKVRSAITEKTAAIISVNLYGNMPDYDALEAICDEHNITLIEDAAEALGSSFKGRPAGSFGNASVFSFHRTKTLTTGEGGAVLLNDAEAFNKASFYRDHGRAQGKIFFNDEIAYKYMPSNLMGALGCAQLDRIDELINRKKEILAVYKDCFKDVDEIKLNPQPKDGENGAWSSVAVFSESSGVKKEKIMEQLNKRGLDARPFFYPLSTMPAVKRLKSSSIQECPTSLSLGDRAICLPSSYIYEDADLIEYANVIRDILGYKSVI